MFASSVRTRDLLATGFESQSLSRQISVGFAERTATDQLTILVDLHSGPVISDVDHVPSRSVTAGAYRTTMAQAVDRFSRYFMSARFDRDVIGT
ncbi:MAG: hypothetical protein WA484_09420, partial [Solirubrobacteraceae bacterium]